MMKLRAVTAVILMLGCTDTVPKSDYDKLQAELDRARSRAAAAESELQALKTTPEQLLNEARVALSEGGLGAARTAAQKLLTKHPSDPGAAEAARIVAEVDRIEREAADAKKKKVAAAMKAMRVEKDEVRGIEFHSHQDATKFLNSRSEIAVYFSSRNGVPETTFFKIQYVADDWLFVHGYTIKADDAVFEIQPPAGRIERDHGSGQIWEWYETPMGPKENEIIRAMLTAKKVIVRYHGQQYYKDRVVPPAEVERIRQVLAAKSAL